MPYGWVRQPATATKSQIVVRMAESYPIHARIVIVTRRTWLLGTAFAVVAAPLVRMGWVWRRRHPRDLAPIPWIGHC
jgi:hypothetical protein